ncbi:MAG: TetR/AcrR family transcriptional regulator [Bacteroidia bacterium]
MSKTKAKILDTSRKLFNRKGFSEVTIRMIANELKMSSGNLNYHFKKREDILEALYFEMVEAFDNRVEQLGTTQITLQTIKDDMFNSLSRMIEYRFFWTDLYNLLRQSDKIKSHYDKVYNKRFEGYVFLFNYLNEKDILQPFEFALERDLLIERMIGYSNTWLYNSLIYDKKIDTQYIENETNHLMAMLYPYFTQSAKKNYRALFPKHFV